MAEAMRFVSGNTTCIIMDDCCSHPDQAKRDAEIKKRVADNALRGIRANPERYYKRLAEIKKAGT